MKNSCRSTKVSTNLIAGRPPRRLGPAPVSCQVVAVAHTFVEVWEAAAALLAELDVLLSFAEAAVVALVARR